MRVIAFFQDDATFKNLLPYFNNSAEIIFADPKNIVASLFTSNWDYIITQGNFAKQLVDAGIDSARIIDVDFILNDDYVKKVFLAVALQNKISDFESIVVGDFAAAMGFNADEFILNTANLASSYQDLKISYLWIKAAITAPNSKIKYAVIGLSPHCLRYDLNLTADKWQSLSYYSIFKGLMKFPLTDDVMSALFDENFLNVYELSNVNYSANANQYADLNFFDPLEEKKLNNRPLGQEDVFAVRSDARQWDAEKYLSVAQINTEIFIDCLKLCRDNNVTPIVVKLPSHTFYKSLFPEELITELDAMLYRAKKIVPFRLIDAFSWNLQDGREFCRMDALNSIGAKRTTYAVNILLQKAQRKKIRVGFICQGGDLDKLEPVYEVMRKRDDTDVYLLAVPPYENYNLGQPFDANDERYIKAQAEILKNYGDNENTTIIKTVTESGGVDLEPYHLDYVFYWRPYEVLLPPNVRCQNVARFAKTCYVPYSVMIFENGVGFALNNFDFFNNLNFYFPDSEGFAKISRQAYETSAENSDQHFVCLGSPEMDEFGKTFASEFEINLNKKRNSVMWAPRWTYMETMGGSHFIEYKENFVSLRKKYPKLKMSIRPHRLLFPTMVNENRMTEDEVQRYKKSLQENKIHLDEDDPLQSALAEADIMIADITSIIPLYFLTGNPIIYCESGYNFFGDSKLIESAIYKADSWEEVEKYLAMLLSGEDPLKDERRRLIKQLNQIHNGAAERITQAIIDDYYKNKF